MATTVGIVSTDEAPAEAASPGTEWAVPDTLAGYTTALAPGATAALVDTSTAAGPLVGTTTVGVGVASGLATAAAGLAIGYGIGWSGVQAVQFVKGRWFSYHAPEVNSTGFRTATLSGITLRWVSTQQAGRFMTFEVSGSRRQTRFDYPRVDVQFSRQVCSDSCSTIWADTPSNDGDDVPGAVVIQDAFYSGEPSRFFRLRLQASGANDTTDWVALSPTGDIGYLLRTEWTCQSPDGSISGLQSAESSLFATTADAPGNYPDAICAAPTHIVSLRHLIVPVHQVDSTVVVADDWTAPSEYTSTTSPWSDCLALASEPCTPGYLDENGEPFVPDGTHRPASSVWGSHVEPYPSTAPPPPKPITEDDVQTVAESFAGRIYRNADGSYVAGVQPTPEDYRTASRACISYLAYAGITNPVGDCTRSAVFIVGQDAQQAAEHDWAAMFLARTIATGQTVASRPDWISLNYWANPDLTPGWYTGSPPCSPSAVGLQCDEYPFRTTTQASEQASSLRHIRAEDNQLEGSRYGTFTVKCLEDSGGVPTPESQFFTVPLPAGAVPTFGVCSGTGAL